MASDGPQKDMRCKICGKTFKYTDWVAQKQHCEMQSKSPGNAQGSIEPSQKQTAQGEQHVNNPASGYAQGGINNAPRVDAPVSSSELLTSAAEGLVKFALRCHLELSPDQVLMMCSDKSSSSAECCGGDERRGRVHPIAGLEEDRNRDAIYQEVTNRVIDSDATQKQKRKPDLSTDDLQENVKADTGIHGHGHPSVRQMQNKRLGLNLVPHNSSVHEVTTLRVSSIGTSSDEEVKTISGGVDINNPEHTDSSVIQMQETLGPNLLPQNDSSDHEAQIPGVSSMDDLNVQVSADTNSDKEMKTVNGGQL
uniref:Uncharacterized protein n=1 Tax=Leersia perrieri TaxID=77586 RepID=A0A0D9Y0T8_9ORYZ